MSKTMARKIVRKAKKELSAAKKLASRAARKLTREVSAMKKPLLKAKAKVAKRVSKAKKAATKSLTKKRRPAKRRKAVKSAVKRRPAARRRTVKKKVVKGRKSVKKKTARVSKSSSKAKKSSKKAGKRMAAKPSKKKPMNLASNVVTKKVAPKQVTGRRKSSISKPGKLATVKRASRSETLGGVFSKLAPVSLAIADIQPYQEKSGEEYMNDAQRTHFRKLLNSWREQLIDDMLSTVHHMQDEAANFPDPNDRATQEEEFSLELRTRDRELKLVKKIEEALHKLDNHEYGYCESCGVKIGIRRLEARPTATLCIDCKTLDEIRERQLAG